MHSAKRYKLSSLSAREKFYLSSLSYLAPSPDNYQTKRYMRSMEKVLYERKRLLGDPNNVAIHPFSIFRIYWEAVVLGAYTIHYFVRPVFISFLVRAMSLYYSTWHAALLISNLVFLFDILVTFNTGYYDHQEKIIILNKHTVRLNYLKGFFVLDLVTSIPFDFVMVMCGLSFHYYFYCQLLNILKLVRFHTYLRYFCNSVEVVFKEKVSNRYTKHLLVFLWVMNVSACSYNVMSTVFDALKQEVYESYFVNPGVVGEPSKILKYFVCTLYTIGSLASAGCGILFPTRIFEMLTLLFLSLFHGMYKIYMCAFFSDELRGVSTICNEYLEMKSQIEQYMQHKQLPEDTQKRFLDYYHFRYQHKFFREDKIMSTLTENLQLEVVHHTYANVIYSPIFENVSRELVGRIISRVHYEVYLPADVIIRSGTDSLCMFFILRGTVALYTSSGHEMFHMDDGDYFGDLSLIMDSKRFETGVALEMCELLRLDKKDFRELIMADKALFKTMEERATEKINLIQLTDMKQRRSDTSRPTDLEEAPAQVSQ